MPGPTRLIAAAGRFNIVERVAHMWVWDLISQLRRSNAEPVNESY